VSFYRNSDTVRSKAKIWIDLDNSPHVPFFVPIIKELERRGNSTFLTARDCFQVCELADLNHLKYTKLGHHHGKNKIRKLAGLGFRTLQLLPLILREKPDLALSHGSRALMLCSAITRVPCVTIFDYEFASGGVLVNPMHWIMTPEVILDATIQMRKDRVYKYPGIKEDVYVPGFKPDSGLRRSLGLTDDELVVTLRPPASEAHYHNPQSDELFRATVESLSRRPDVRMVMLPRTPKQGAAIKKCWPELFANGKILVPDHAVDGLNLIWNSDLVISGGGTMNREAAALHVPVYSVFRGKIGAVDQYLSRTGRMVLLESPEDVSTRIVLKRRDRSTTTVYGNSVPLDTIVNHLETILSLQRRVKATLHAGLSQESPAAPPQDASLCPPAQ
jgi:uncharacterized protein